MRLSISKSKNCTSYYVADSRREGKKIITKKSLFAHEG